MTTKTLKEYLTLLRVYDLVRAIRIYGQRTLLMVLAILFIGCHQDDDCCILDIKSFPERQQDFSMWQLAQFNFEVQMCYIIKTDDNKIVVIDGGMPDSTDKVKGYLQQLGGHVHTWVVTHPHLDHIGVLLELIKSEEIQIDRIIHSELDEDWVLQNEIKWHELLSNYNQTLRNSSIFVIDAKRNESFSLGDGIKLTILGAKNESIAINAINNSSLVFKIESKSKSVLFLGDLGIEGGKALLLENDPDRFEADYVQMAHHGQNGVGLEFYKAVQAEYALWPTPKWLWENSAENQGPGTGKFQTPEVRAWTENELKIKKNYVAGLVEGNIQID